MKNAYQTFKDFVIKPIVYTGLAATLILSGCGKKEDNTNYESQNQPRVGTEYSFNEFGHLKSPQPSWVTDRHQLRFADLDGDGDLDMIVSTLRKGIFIYENKMPQQKQE